MSGRICILVDRPRASAFAEGQTLWGYQKVFIEDKAKRCGVTLDRIDIRSISNNPQVPGPIDFAQCLKELNAQNYSVIIPLDDIALQFVTGKKSIWKWHMSPLDTLPEFTCRRAVPTFHTDQINKEYYLGLYFEMSLKRANQYSADAGAVPWKRKESRYLLDPSFDESIATLESIRNKPWLSLDIETGRNQINTFGVAWSPEDAIAIKLLPSEMPASAFHKLWSLIRELCEGDAPKVAQNGIYERMYLSRYGILLNNFSHDTMVAMKFLWPELEKGLDNVGRIYTMEPYWKDDGRVSSEEGKQKDWGNIRDWPKHLDYNCKDSSNTLIAMHAQIADLRARGLEDLYSKYIVRLFDCVYEMGARGFPLNTDKQKLLITEYEAKSAALVKQLSKEINPRAPKQKIKLLQDQGLKMPKKKNHKTGEMNDSADELTLKKLRLSYPNNTDIKILLEVAGIEKALSSYLRVRTFPDNRIRFMLDAHGTETGRMSCSKDPWDRGFNAQTMTDYAKNMIEFAPQEDRIFIELDLSQAETRFVAYDWCEENLIRMIEKKEDIHRYVAAEIYRKPMSEIVHDERQLGKKSGHGANYNMGVNTFIDSCLKEMDLVIDKPMATRVLEAYHRLFPGIRRGHAQVRNQIYRERRLTNPLGRVRYFYGRCDDNTYREGFAYRAQSTVPDVVNKLMLGLKDQRTEGALDFWLHCQTHDSITLSCKPDERHNIMKFSRKYEAWHPELILPAGKLIIPVDGKFGRCLGEMTKYA